MGSPAEISKFSIYRDIKFLYITLQNFHSFIHYRLDLAVFHLVSVSEAVVWSNQSDTVYLRNAWLWWLWTMMLLLLIMMPQSKF